MVPTACMPVRTPETTNDFCKLRHRRVTQKIFSILFYVIPTLPHFIRIFST